MRASAPSPSCARRGAPSAAVPPSAARSPRVGGEGREPGREVSRAKRRRRDGGDPAARPSGGGSGPPSSRRLLALFLGALLAAWLNLAAVAVANANDPRRRGEDAADERVDGGRRAPAAASARGRAPSLRGEEEADDGGRASATVRTLLREREAELTARADAELRARTDAMAQELAQVRAEMDEMARAHGDDLDEAYREMEALRNKAGGGARAAPPREGGEGEEVERLRRRLRAREADVARLERENERLRHRGEKHETYHKKYEALLQEREGRPQV